MNTFNDFDWGIIVGIVAAKEGLVRLKEMRQQLDAYIESEEAMIPTLTEPKK